jgi:hypothetical protein
MATVPGSPSSNVTPMLPPWARPTPADFLQAVAIMQERNLGRLEKSLTPEERLKLGEKEMEENIEHRDPAFGRNEGLQRIPDEQGI